MMKLIPEKEVENKACTSDCKFVVVQDKYTDEKHI